MLGWIKKVFPEKYHLDLSDSSIDDTKEPVLTENMKRATKPKCVEGAVAGKNPEMNMAYKVYMATELELYNKRESVEVNCEGNPNSDKEDTISNISLEVFDEREDVYGDKCVSVSCCFPPAFLPPACLYNQLGKLCTLLGDRYILTNINSAPVLVSTATHSSSGEVRGAMMVWRGGSLPMVLQELPDGTDVFFDAVALKNTAEFAALAIWQDIKPRFIAKPYFNDYVIVEEFRNREVKFLTSLKEGGFFSADIHGRKRVVVFSKSVFFIDGQAVNNMMEANVLECKQMYADVCMVAAVNISNKAMYSFICNCLWVGEEPIMPKLDLLVLYRNNGFTDTLRVAKRQWSLHCDVEAELVMGRKSWSLKYIYDKKVLLLPCCERIMFCGNRRASPGNGGIVTAHVRRSVNKEGASVFKVLMVQLPQSLVAQPDIQKSPTCCLKETVSIQTNLSSSQSHIITFPLDVQRSFTSGSTGSLSTITTPPLTTQRYSQPHITTPSPSTQRSSQPHISTPPPSMQHSSQSDALTDFFNKLHIGISPISKCLSGTPCSNQPLTAISTFTLPSFSLPPTDTFSSNNPFTTTTTTKHSLTSPPHSGAVSKKSAVITKELTRDVQPIGASDVLQSFLANLKDIPNVPEGLNTVNKAENVEQETSKTIISSEGLEDREKFTKSEDVQKLESITLNSPLPAPSSPLPQSTNITKSGSKLLLPMMLGNWKGNSGGFDGLPLYLRSLSGNLILESEQNTSKRSNSRMVLNGQRTSNNMKSSSNNDTSNSDKSGIRNNNIHSDDADNINSNQSQPKRLLHVPSLEGVKILVPENAVISMGSGLIVPAAEVDQTTLVMFDALRTDPRDPHFTTLLVWAPGSLRPTSLTDLQGDTTYFDEEAILCKTGETNCFHLSIDNKEMALFVSKNDFVDCRKKTDYLQKFNNVAVHLKRRKNCCATEACQIIAIFDIMHISEGSINEQAMLTQILSLKKKSKNIKYNKHPERAYLALEGKLNMCSELMSFTYDYEGMKTTQPLLPDVLLDRLGVAGEKFHLILDKNSELPVCGWFERKTREAYTEHFLTLYSHDHKEKLLSLISQSGELKHFQFDSSYLVNGITRQRVGESDNKGRIVHAVVDKIELQVIGGHKVYRKVILLTNNYHLCQESLKFLALSQVDNESCSLNHTQKEQHFPVTEFEHPDTLHPPCQNIVEDKRESELPHPLCQNVVEDEKESALPVPDPHPRNIVKDEGGRELPKETAKVVTNEQYTEVDNGPAQASLTSTLGEQESSVITIDIPVLMKGKVMEVYREMGLLQLYDGLNLYFSREICFLYSICLVNVDLRHIITSGLEVEYETCGFGFGLSLTGVCVERPVTLEPNDHHNLSALLETWCSTHSVPEATKATLFLEAEILDMDLYPLADPSQDKDIVN